MKEYCVFCLDDVERHKQYEVYDEINARKGRLVQVPDCKLHGPYWDEGKE